MREQCGAFAKTKGQQCKNKSLPGSIYCILHLEKTPLLIGALVGAILGLIVTVVRNKIIPSAEMRELSVLKADIRPVLDLAREAVPNASDKDALALLVREISAERVELRELKTEIRPVLDIARKNAPNVSDNEAIAALINKMNEVQKAQNTIRSFETEVAITVAGNWAANIAPQITVMVMGDDSEDHLDIKLKNGNIKRTLLYVQGNVNISKIENGDSILRYRTQVKSGDWPINEDSSELLSCEAMGVVMWGFKKSYMIDGMIWVKRIDVNIFINGEKKLTMTAPGGGPLSVPNENEGSATIDFREHQVF